MRKRKDIYIKILLWAHDRQEAGFTWEQLRVAFKLNQLQEGWIRKIFFTVSDNDRKFFEHLRREETPNGNFDYYSLNEKGMSAAVNYKGLKQAENSSTYALLFAGVSALLAAAGLFFQVQQTKLAELQSTSERIGQARAIQDARERCKESPELQDSGLYHTDDGKSAPCSEVLQRYK